MSWSRYFAFGTFLAILFVFLVQTTQGYRVQIEKNAAFLQSSFSFMTANEIKQAMNNQLGVVAQASFRCGKESIASFGDPAIFHSASALSPSASLALTGVQVLYNFTTQEQRACQMFVTWPWPVSLVSLLALTFIFSFAGLLYFYFDRRSRDKEESIDHSRLAIRLSRDLREPVARMRTVLALMEEADIDELRSEYLPALHESRAQLESKLVNIVRRDN